MTCSLFLVSGAIHQVTSWQLNSGCADFADVYFFCTNAAAVIVESALLQVIRPRQSSAVGGRREAERSHPSRPLRNILARLVGYVWVVSFFVWAIPKFYYPRIYCMVNQKE